jgi:hypothetical protein
MQKKSALTAALTTPGDKAPSADAARVDTFSFPCLTEGDNAAEDVGKGLSALDIRDSLPGSAPTANHLAGKFTVRLAFGWQWIIFPLGYPRFR